MNQYYWFEYLPESKILFFQYNKVLDDSAEPLRTFAERLGNFVEKNDVEHLIIDMRWNNGGDTFLNEALLRRLIGIKKLNEKGRLFVIIGRRTFSAAGNAAIYFERLTNAIFVGEPTGSKPNVPGDETIFRLPYSGMSRKRFRRLLAIFLAVRFPQLDPTGHFRCPQI